VQSVLWVLFLSICLLWMFMPIVLLCTATACSTLKFIGVIPFIMQSASCEILRCSFAILKLRSLCTLVYFRLLYSFFIESIHTGALYSNCGNIAPLYIIFSASWFSPQIIIAYFDRAFINLVLLSVIYGTYSLNLNLLSIIMPRYFSLSTCAR